MPVTVRCSVTGRKVPPPVAPGIREAGCMEHVRRKFMVLYKMNGSPGAKENEMNGALGKAALILRV